MTLLAEGKECRQQMGPILWSFVSGILLLTPSNYNIGKSVRDPPEDNK